MTLTRRDFVRNTAIGGAAVGLTGLLTDPAGAAFSRLRSDRPLKILILGGTAFLGPHVVRCARARGHEVTLFNRGRTNTHLFPDVEKLVGDRDGNLEALRGREWDVVLDNCGYVPRIVTDSAKLLADRVDQYIFISSISVYADFSKPGIDEDSPVGVLEDETVEKIDGQTYGPLKALCEQAAAQFLPGRTCNIRPGLIVGPMDRTDRFTYWPVRVQKGGEVLAPGPGTDLLQVIDVRDLAAFIVRCAEQGINGVFNADSPPGEMDMKELLETCRNVAGSDAAFTWVDAEFLAEHEVAPWSDMPVWVPPTGDEAGFATVRVDRALAEGLVFRPISETIRDTLAWWKHEPEERKSSLRAGLTAEREAEVLKLWHEKG